MRCGFGGLNPRISNCGGLRIVKTYRTHGTVHEFKGNIVSPQVLHLNLDEIFDRNCGPGPSHYASSNHHVD